VIDHTGVDVGAFARSKAWYRAALAPLGYVLVREVPAARNGGTDAAGFGEAKTGIRDFGIAGAAVKRPATTPPGHFAVRAMSRAAVDALYACALSAKGTDNGAPGLRSHYHPHYYAAFILDPDGHHIEAVCHAPQ
jgi:catechol 2,3-dioxygenase-like lactoylglutathione lyase family enzyme